MATRNASDPLERLYTNPFAVAKCAQVNRGGTHVAGKGRSSVTPSGATAASAVSANTQPRHRTMTQAGEQEARFPLPGPLCCPVSLSGRLVRLPHPQGVIPPRLPETHLQQ